jgi:integrase
MAKTLTEAKVTTRNARAQLPTGLHFKGIDPEVHLGYRKNKRGGMWFVRWRNGRGYRQVSLGVADDELREGTLNYDAAVRKARKAVEAARKEARAAADGPAPTVRAAVEAYVAFRDKRESERRKRPVRSDANRLARYVMGRDKRGKRAGLPPTTLADKPLHALTERDLMTWRNRLPEALKASSKQRLINDLKAALNNALGTHRDRLDPNLPSIVKHGLKAMNGHAGEGAEPVRDNQILTDAKVGKLISAAQAVDAEQDWEGDLSRLVIVLAATGARFSQVARMRVGDVQRAQSRLLVPVSRKGRGVKSGTTAVAVGKDVLDALLPALTGRMAAAPLLERWRYKQVTSGADGIKWERAGRGPWQSAAELARPWQAVRQRAAMPDVIPYALRHSSIVRGIKAGLPIRLVAALHDTSVQMIERHYSRWIVDGLDELAARAVVPLVPKAGKVVRMRGQA